MGPHSAEYRYVQYRQSKFPIFIYLFFIVARLDRRCDIDLSESIAQNLYLQGTWRGRDYSNTLSNRRKGVAGNISFEST